MNKVIFSWTLTFMSLFTTTTKIHSFIWTDEVQLHNKTDKDYYAGLYITKDRTALLVNDMKVVSKRTCTNFARPPFKVGTGYKIFVSSNKSLFKNKVYKDEAKRFLQINAGKFFGSRFYLVHRKRKLDGLNLLSWKIYIRKETLKKHYLQQDPTSKNEAVVSSTLSEHEQEYVYNKLPLIKENLEKFLGIELQENQTLRMGLCCSGGGFRAMFAALGLTEGFQELGLLNCQLYYSALSGSSWMLLPWIASGKDFNSFKQDFITSAQKRFWKPSKEATLSFSETVKKKTVCDQRLTVIDWYGTLLADKLLNKDFDLTLFDLATKLNVYEHPFPISNATFKGVNKEYEWIEISPYEISCDYLKSSIPAWALGRKFKSGFSQNHTSQPTLGTVMGILGSSFSGSLDDLFNKYLPQTYLSLNSYPFYNKASAILQSFPAAHKKFSPAKFPNFTFGLENSPMKNIKSLELVDGGFACNTPLATLLKSERGLDVIFVLDSKQDVPQQLTALKIAEKEAKRLGLKMPKIDYDIAGKEQISIFQDKDDTTCPVIVYIPLKKDETYSKIFDPASSKFCSTYNFTYTRKQAETLSGLTRHIIASRRDLFTTLLKSLVSNR